ncbi:MAG: ATP-binding cassette domain-containing protein [Ornithinimicrobium sp.]
MITVHDLTHRYDRAEVLRDIGLTIATGQLTSLVGPNGAGKSTLLGAVSRLLRPNTGHVWLDDLDVFSAAGNDVARRLAVLRQDTATTARLTVRELTQFGRFPYSRGRLRAEDHAAVAQALDYTDLAGLADRFLDQLSGGQRQRAFIAMVLAQDTDHVLLDEPLNNLDMQHAAATMQLLRRAVHDLGRTVVVVLHDINMASCYSDSIVGMRDGRVMVQGPPDEVMQGEVLERIFDVPLSVHEVAGQRIAMHWAPTDADHGAAAGGSALKGLGSGVGKQRT